jgi:mannose-6-phosphate isomerase-like protein (cupin superfamily)
MPNREPEQHWSKPRGMLPNSRFPLLVHRGAVPGGGADALIARFRENGWYNNWNWPGVYPYPHFHSTTHEALGVAAGWMEIEVFGRGGTRFRVEAGDVVVMPAGVSHGMTAQSELARAATKRIFMLPIPSRDPATGQPMREWIEAPSSVDAGLNEFRDGLDPV